MAEGDRIAVNRIFAETGKALAAFQIRLESRDSAFDRFATGLLSGDARALDELGKSARSGLRIFVGRGQCTLCHSGPMLSDGEFHDARARPRDAEYVSDPGRAAAVSQLRDTEFGVAGLYADEPNPEMEVLLEHLRDTPESFGQLRTPSLRNVATTAPYMSKGQFATLLEVVRFYSRGEGAARVDHHGEQVIAPLRLTSREEEDLVAFLQSLTDTSSVAGNVENPWPTASESLSLGPPGFSSTDLAGNIPESGSTSSYGSGR
jgi:cytochrome c peroxidase